jgi:hypothetical protein
VQYFILPLIASIETVEVIKILINKGDLLKNRILFIDLLKNDFDIVDIMQYAAYGSKTACITLN